MRILFLAIFMLLVSNSVFSQSENYEFDGFSVSVNENMVTAKLSSGEVFYSAKFNNLTESLVDLDNDSLPEFCVTTKNITGKNEYYKVYVFNAVDSFYLADSLESLNIEPYTIIDEESGKSYLVTGNPALKKIAGKNEEKIYPSIDCYGYDGNAFFRANDQVYDVFMQANEELLDSVDVFYKSNAMDCSKSNGITSCIAAVYLNYKNANEDSMALHFLNKYYFCNDIMEFKARLGGLLKK
jgi:hypothetical protein